MQQPQSEISLRNWRQEESTPTRTQLRIRSVTEVSCCASVHTEKKPSLCLQYSLILVSHRSNSGNGCLPACRSSSMVPLRQPIRTTQRLLSKYILPQASLTSETVWPHWVFPSAQLTTRLPEQLISIRGQNTAAQTHLSLGSSTSVDSRCSSCRKHCNLLYQWYRERSPLADGLTITEKPSKSMRNTLTFSFLGLLLVACNANTAKLQPDQPATTLPKKFSLSVPFTVQAPFADWGDPYQEACEEAALLIVHSYLAGNVLTKEQADKDLLAPIAWEEQQGFAQDITLTELAEVAAAYFGYRAEVIQDASIQEIQTQIALGNPVIVPAAGRMLGNTYFSGEGPWYHMLVITGYDGKWI